MMRCMDRQQICHSGPKGCSLSDTKRIFDRSERTRMASNTDVLQFQANHGEECVSDSRNPRHPWSIAPSYALRFGGPVRQAPTAATGKANACTRCATIEIEEV